MAETTTGTQGSGANSSSINPFSMIGAGADMMTNFLPQPTEYSGDAGHIAAGIDSAWDGASNAMMGFPPIGTAIGGIMKGAKFLGRAANALGAGTDGMTTQDAILGSPLFNLTPFGIINGVFGERADTFTKDQEVFAQMGSSYGGTSSQADAAASKSGKKYGLFSLGAKNEANRLIRETSSQQNLIKDIQEDTNEQNLRALSMTQQASQQYVNRMNGGFQQGMIRAARQGALLFDKQSIKRAKLFAAKGAKIEELGWPDYIQEDQGFMNFIKTCPKEIKQYSEDKEFLYDLWTSNGKYETFDKSNKAILPLFIKSDDDTFSINPDLIYFMEMQGDEFDMNSDQKVQNNQSNLTTESENEDLGSEDEGLQAFKEGGQLNVIPEGALHAHKHNLEKINEDLKGNITHKGIPVVSVDDEGNIEQQAEVERNELILNLETTNAIEDLRKKYHDEDSKTKKDRLAEEAGKIFAKSVIENTDDRTNLMNEV